MQVVRRFEVLTHVTLDSSQLLLMNLFNKQTLDTCPKHPVSFDLIDQPEYYREASRGDQLEAEDSSSRININMEGAWISQDNE
jgi:hypothetical protein